MSDTGRKGLGDKVSETMTPDSTKSSTEKAKEGITDMRDKATSAAQSDDHKSVTQGATDKAGNANDEHKEGGSAGSLLDSAKHAVGMDKK